MVDIRRASCCRIWGHRGSPRNAPENTLASLETALREGADGVEFDVHLTRDGVPVVIHDDTLDRTTNATGPVSRRTAAELRGLDAGSWFSPRFRGESVPRLEEVLDLVAAAKAEAVLEIKDGRPSAIGAFASAVAARGCVDRVYFHSFAPADLRVVRGLLPRARIQLIGEVGTALLDQAQALGATACSPYDEHLRPDQIPAAWVKQARAGGMELNAGLVNDPAILAQLSALGVGAVFTDVPGVLASRRR